MAVQKFPTAVQMATVAHTNGHNVIVAVSSETAVNPVHISYRISYVFLQCLTMTLEIFMNLVRNLGVTGISKNTNR